MHCRFMRWAMAGRNSAIAATAAVAALLGASPAGAVTFEHTMNYHGETMTCGFYVRLGICGTFQSISPVSAVAGDRFHITVDSTVRVKVPGSNTGNGFFVTAYDAGATPGPDFGTAVKSQWMVSGTGLETTAGVAPYGLTSGPHAGERAHDYAGFLSYGGTYGIPNDGFSLTGLDANLTVVTADPMPTVGLSFGYYWRTDNAAAALMNFAGGTIDAPVILPHGLVGSISSTIGGDGPTSQFYNFNWDGGTFQTRASLNGAAPGSEFTFKLLTEDRAFKRTLLLNDANSFNALFSEFDLAGGRYLIGLESGNVPDPMFTFDFLTPIGADAAVPEPATWVILILGMAGVGGVLRRRRAVGTFA